MSMLPACREPWATGLEVLAVAATGQGLPASTILSLLPATHRDTHMRTGPQEGSAPDPSAWLSWPGQIHGAAHTAQPGACGWGPDTRPQLWGQRWSPRLLRPQGSPQAAQAG